MTKQQAEFICGCRSCGNHCLVVERVRAAEGGDVVVYTDGYQGGWQGIQTEVVTCPHCGIVISWRKNCSSADLLRQAGDLERFYLPPAMWGPPALYWSGFRKYDRTFHPSDPPVASGAPLPRLTRAPDPADQWALRKRGWVAIGLLWLENDTDRADHFFGRTRPPPRDEASEGRRRLLLRALIEAAEFGAEPTEGSALERAEWHRELGEWELAARVLDRNFDEAVLAQRARQLRELVEARNAAVVPFVAAGPSRAELNRQRLARHQGRPAPGAVLPAPVAEPAAPVAGRTAGAAGVTGAGGAPAAVPAAPAAAAPVAGPSAAASAVPAALASAVPASDGTSPRALLATLLEVLGTMPAETLTRKYIPRPYGALLRSLMKTQDWDEESFAVTVIRAFGRAHGWPAGFDPQALQQFEAFEVNEGLLAWLAVGFKRANWDKWAFDVPPGAPPKG